MRKFLNLSPLFSLKSFISVLFSCEKATRLCDYSPSPTDTHTHTHTMCITYVHIFFKYDFFAMSFSFDFFCSQVLQ